MSSSKTKQVRVAVLLLCRGVKKYGGKVQLNAHVDHVQMERGRATGVVLKSGQVIKARKVGFDGSAALSSLCALWLHRDAQHSTAQHSTAQHSTAQQCNAI